MAWVAGSFPEEITVRHIEKIPSRSALFRIAIESSLAATTQGILVFLRMHLDSEWLTRHPDLARREAIALRVGAAAGLPIPRLIRVDEDGSLCGAPAVLMTQVRGNAKRESPDSPPALSAAASLLASIHSVDVDNALRPFRLHYPAKRYVPPLWSRHPHQWNRAIEFTIGRVPTLATGSSLLHGDYRLGNLLWLRDTPVGAIDWVNAARGAFGADVGHCRMNLLMTTGQPSADRFLADYAALAPGRQYEPAWDVASATGWLPDLPVLTSSKALEFENFAFSALAEAQ